MHNIIKFLGAQSVTPPTSNNSQNMGVGEVGEGAAGTTDLIPMITSIINGVIGVLGIVCVVVMIIGGINYMTSAGDSNKVKKGKDTILYGLIGLV